MVLPDRWIESGCVLLEQGRIAWVGPERDAPDPPLGARVLDAAGGWIAPGFIDVHVHGGGGADVMDGSPEALVTIARAHARHGTTGWLATTVTAPHEALAGVCRTAARLVGRPTGGATLLGVHLEGPYISATRRGAQNPAFLRPPDLDELEALLSVLGGALRLVTIAPELPGALDAIRLLVSRGVAVSLGHTDATYEQACAALAAGATHATHTFNGMRGLHHRDPGVAAAVLESPGVTCEVIADGLHVHPAMLRLVHRVKGAQRTVLVTDCIRAMGLPDGRYDLGGLEVQVAGGAARLSDDPQTLAGSLLTMDRAVRRMVEEVGVDVVEAVRMASLVPARVAGVADRKGSLEPGKDADVLLLTPDFEAAVTLVEGRPVTPVP